MENNKEMEELMVNFELPYVREGVHRARLKSQLLSEAQNLGQPLIFWRKRLAWACCIILLVTATAWAAQKFYKTYIVDENVEVKLQMKPLRDSLIISSPSPSRSGLSTGNGPPRSRPFLNMTSGTKIFSANPESTIRQIGQPNQSYRMFVYSNDQIVKVTVTSDGKTSPSAIKQMLPNWNSQDPSFNDERGRIQYQEMMKIAAQNMGRLKTNKGKDGSKEYVYQFTLSDGTEIEYSTALDPEALRQKGDFMEKWNSSTPLLTKVEKSPEGMLMATYAMIPPGDPSNYRWPLFNHRGLNSLKISEQNEQPLNRVEFRKNWEDDPYHEIPELIRAGKGVLLEKKTLPGTKVMYIYEFTLSNGERVKYGSPDKPLEAAQPGENPRKQHE